MENGNQIVAAENLQLKTLPEKECMVVYSTASNLQLSKEESNKLIEAFDDSMIEIREDGFIYLPQAHYRHRLNETLGLGQWALLPKTCEEEVVGTKIKLSLNGILVIRGCFVAESVGEVESDAKKTFATRWEGAKSDCITRCCKDLSIAKQISDPVYMRNWQSNYAICVRVSNYDKPKWRKKEGNPLPFEVGPWFSSAPGAKNSTDKKWLNKTHQATGGSTGEWTQVVKGIVAGTESMESIELAFRLNKDIKSEVIALFGAVKAAKTAGYNPLFIELLLNCINKEDVVRLALKNKATIQGNTALRALFADRQNNLPSHLKTA